MSTCGHERVVCICGNVIRQCRCIGPKKTTTKTPCTCKKDKTYLDNLFCQIVHLSNEYLYTLVDIYNTLDTITEFAWIDFLNGERQKSIDNVSKAKEIIKLLEKALKE